MNLSFNMSMNQTQFHEICELNQYKMLDQVSKYPKVAFYFAVIVSLAIIIRYLVYTNMKESRTANNLKGLSEMLMVMSFPCLLYFMMFTTFRITEEIYNHYIEPSFIIIVVGLLIFIIARDYKKIKKWLQDHSEK